MIISHIYVCLTPLSAWGLAIQALVFLNPTPRFPGVLRNAQLNDPERPGGDSVQLVFVYIGWVQGSRIRTEC
ncbi:hypothetical protein F5B21DRAFT_468124, partial [Xylaria acuta]